MAPAVEHHVLPHLVAEGDRVMRHAIAGEKGEIVRFVDRARRIQRIVEEHETCPGREGRRQLRLVEAPAWRR